MGILGRKMEIGPETIIQRKNNVLYNNVDGEVVMLSIENGEYYGLNKVGSRIFEYLNEPLSFAGLISRLLKDFEVTEIQCTEDTLTFLKMLNKKDLLIIH